MVFDFNDHEQHVFLIPQIQSYRLCNNVLIVERVSESCVERFALIYASKKVAQKDHAKLTEHMAKMYKDKAGEEGNPMGFLAEACGYTEHIKTDFDDEDDDDDGGEYVQ